MTNNIKKIKFSQLNNKLSKEQMKNVKEVAGILDGLAITHVGKGIIAMGLLFSDCVMHHNIGNWAY